MRLFKNWDKEEKASAVRILGLVMAALTVFMLIASVSYLFHWKQDMSLLAGADASDAGQPVGNAAGRLGFRTGYLLVCELFGMGCSSHTADGSPALTTSSEADSAAAAEP